MAEEHTEGDVSFKTIDVDGNVVLVSLLSIYDYRMVNRILDGGLELTSNAPNGLTYGEIVEKMSVTSVDDYMEILRDYGKDESEYSVSKLLGISEVMTFDISPPSDVRSAVLKITHIDASGGVVTPTMIDGSFSVEQVSNDGSPTVSSLDFGTGVLTLAGSLLTEESNGIAQINITPNPAAEATVTPVEYLITLSYI
jgi:hypothetical protein